MFKGEELRLMMRLSRPFLLIPGFLLYALGALFSVVNGLRFDLGKFFFGYTIFFFAHLSLSFSNDYFDRETDRQSQETMVSGGSKVLVKHPELAPLALKIAIALIVLSAIAAAAFVVIFSYPTSFLIFSVLGALIGWFYTAPPQKFVHRGLGEITTALASGLVMPGMGYFVMSGTIDWKLGVLSIPLVLYGFFFIFTVEMPDVESDRLGGKTNLLVRRGLTTGLMAMVMVNAGATVSLSIIAYTGVLGTIINFWYLALFSPLLLLIAVYGAIRNIVESAQLLGQVKLNFLGMMAFLIFFVLYSTTKVSA